MHRLLLTASRLRCFSCPCLHVLPHVRALSVGACCCGVVLLLPLSSWSFRSLSLCTNLFWTLRCRLEHLHPSLCCSVTKHVQRRVLSLLANIFIARPCGRSCALPSHVRRRLVRATLSFFLNVVPTCFCRRRRSSATAAGTSFFV